MRRFGAGEFPAGDVREEVCEDEVDGRIVVVVVAGGRGQTVSQRVHISSSPAGGCKALLLRVIFLNRLEFQRFINLPFEFRGRPAGAGAEVDEGVVFDRGTQQRLQGSDDKRGGGARLEGREAFRP